MEYSISNRMKAVKGSAIREIFKYAADPEVISLAGGNPAPELFPAAELSAIAADLLTHQPTLSLQYGITEGYTPLRDALKKRLAEREGIGRESDDLLIMSGGQQGIDLTTKVLLNEGDVILVEEPSFIGALNAFRSYGVKLVGIPLEEGGVDPRKVEKAIAENENVKAMYVIPTFQNPMGTTMTLEKRKGLYEVAKRHGLILIEDNPYGELTFDGSKLPTLKSMDTEGLVVYCGSFSKILAPGLRVGFLCADKALTARIAVAKQTSDVHTPMLTQLLCYEFLRRYDIDALIEKMRATYAHRCDVMLRAIEQYFPKGVTYTRPGGGLFIWCDLGHGLDAAALAPQAAANKVVFVPGSAFMVDGERPTSTLRLNYSTMSDERIVEGIKRLGDLFTRVLAEQE